MFPLSEKRINIREFNHFLLGKSVKVIQTFNLYNIIRLALYELYFKSVLFTISCISFFGEIFLILFVNVTLVLKKAENTREFFQLFSTFNCKFVINVK